MRRIVIVLAVLALGLGVAPAADGSAARAATGTLTVTTLGRDGTAVRTSFELARTGSLRTWWFTSNQAHRVAAGSYLLMTDVFDGRDETDTLAARRVTVSGATRITIDARRGRPVDAALDPAPPTGYHQHFLMSLCQADGAGEVDGFTYGNRLYVIPTATKGVDFAFAAIWQADDPDARGPRYLAAAVHHDGLPDGMRRTFAQSALTHVRIGGRSGVVSGTPYTQFSARATETCRAAVSRLDVQAALPYSFTAVVPPGQWVLSQQAQDMVYDAPRTYRAGRAYSITVGRSAWGPSGRLPYTNRATGRLVLSTLQPFSDPALEAGPLATVTYRVTKAGRTLLKRTALTDGPDVSLRLPAAGWYTITADARRHPEQALPADVLSPRASLRLHVYADPAADHEVRAYVTRFLPRGLDARNRAAAGRTTTVDLRLLRGGPTDAQRQRDAVRTVRAWGSADGGAHWHAVSVRHSGSRWWALVPNPAAGFVSLRATVTDSHRDTATTTVTRAYAVN